MKMRNRVLMNRGFTALFAVTIVSIRPNIAYFAIDVLGNMITIAVFSESA